MFNSYNDGLDVLGAVDFNKSASATVLGGDADEDYFGKGGGGHGGHGHGGGHHGGGWGWGGGDYYEPIFVTADEPVVDLKPKKRITEVFGIEVAGRPLWVYAVAAVGAFAAYKMYKGRK